MYINRRQRILSHPGIWGENRTENGVFITKRDTLWITTSRSVSRMLQFASLEPWILSRLLVNVQAFILQVQESEVLDNYLSLFVFYDERSVLLGFYIQLKWHALLQTFSMFCRTWYSTQALHRSLKQNISIYFDRDWPHIQKSDKVCKTAQPLSPNSLKISTYS